MCGIVGYVGKKNSLPIILEGLKRLEYRGYDSAGIASLSEDIQHFKSVGKVERLIVKELTGDTGIGHCRWATTGRVGPLNLLLRSLNLDFLVVDWFSTGATSFVIVIIALIWSQHGVAVLIFLTGMSAIDPSVLDWAIVDGANWWKRFIYIVLPMIIGTIEFYLVF